LENGGYRIEEVSDSGTKRTAIDIEAHELPQLMNELCEEEKGLLDTLRQVYQLFEPKSITLHKKEKI